MDIMSVGSPKLDGLPKAPYMVSDNVLNSVIQLQENKQLQKSIKEYKAVVQALQLVNKDSQYIFNQQYQLGKTKWEIINDLHISEETYKRRHRHLVYATHEELKKLTLN